MDISDLCDLCEEYGDRDCKRCDLGNPCIDCADYDMDTDTCTSKGACGDPNGMSTWTCEGACGDPNGMSTWTWRDNGSGVPIGHVNGSIEHKAGNIGRSLTLCQRCAHRKHGPTTITIGDDITINGVGSYCATSGASQMQIVNGAVIKCSKFKEANNEG